MNIKSLLLGSAAALVAVSGARAADAVVLAEPEPVEYVRVCDVYGTSFYYIPGTEICLKVGGYVRYDIGAGDLFGDVGDDTRRATPSTSAPASSSASTPAPRPSSARCAAMRRSTSSGRPVTQRRWRSSTPTATASSRPAKLSTAHDYNARNSGHRARLRRARRLPHRRHRLALRRPSPATLRASSTTV